MKRDMTEPDVEARVTFRTVHASEIDELGHVNNVVYLNWVQEAATEHWQAVAPQNLQLQYIWVCSRHEIDYHDQLYVDDKVEIRTWLGSNRGARFDRFVEMRRTQAKKPNAIAKTTWVLVNKTTGRPVRIPEEILNIFSI